jgi:hypothetical protein
MAEHPKELVGLGTEQTHLLSILDHLEDHNGWDNGQADDLMPRVLQRLNDLGVSLQRIKEVMLASGYDDRALRQIDRWERRRATGSFA